MLQALAQALDAGMSVHQLVHDQAAAALLPTREREATRLALARGGSLAEGLARAGLVDDAGAAVIGAGERGGFLPAALRAVAADVEERRRRRRRLVLALAYPALLVMLASVILPLPIVVTEGVAAYLASAAPGVAAVVVALLLGGVVAPRLPTRWRSLAVGALARMPLVGGVILDDARAAALELLGRLIAAGVPARGALASALGASVLPRVRAHVTHAERALDGGRALADVLFDATVVDESLGARVALAERTGDLDSALPALARELRERAARRVVALTVAAGLLAFLVVAVGIGRALVAQAQATYDAIDRATVE